LLAFTSGATVKFEFEKTITNALKSQNYFATPIFGYADSSDSLFQDYKQIIGSHHMTPAEAFDCRYGEPLSTGTVVVWLLPLVKETILSNRPQKEFPSRAWARTRHFGEMINNEIRKHAEVFFSDQGKRAIAPLFLEEWSANYEECTSNWSERHAAFAAGLGSFGLSDALITPVGTAHRIGSLVTDAVLESTPRASDQPYHHCPFKQDGSCGVCIKRCPTGAITADGHDKQKCHFYLRNHVFPKCNPEFGVDVSGCGLCTTFVPCEQRIPPGRK